MPDPYADMRPELDGNHWITNWIRSKMTPPLEREEKLQKVLTKINNGAKELKEKWALPNKAPGYWRSPAVTCMPPNELAERKLANKMAPSIHGVY